MSIKIRTERGGRVGIVEARGSLIGDEDTDRLREAVADFIEQGIKSLVINLQKVNYINSSGVGAIIAAHTSNARSGGSTKLVGISSAVHNVLIITRLVDVFDVHDTLHDAIESFENSKSNTI
jgi:anti-sigma B factor antagonist